MRCALSSPRKGTVYLSVSNATSIIANYGLYIVLARVLGPRDFGVYGIITGLAVVLSMVLTTGPQQATSKLVAEAPENAASVLWSGLLLQVVLGGVLAVGFLVFSPLTAALLGQPSLSGYLVLIAFAPFCNGLTAVLSGYLNGHRAFGRQAILEALYAATRAGLIIGLTRVALVSGALLGFTLAAALGLLLAGWIAGLPRVPRNLCVSAWWRFSIPLILFALCANALTTADLLLLKALSPAGRANVYAGYYTVALSLARIPWFALTGLTAVLLPVVSSASGHSEGRDWRGSAIKALLLSLGVVILLAVTLTLFRQEIVRVAFSEQYAPAAEVLGVLSFSYAAFGVFMVIASTLIGRGAPWAIVGVGGLALALDVVLGRVLIPTHGPVGAASATCLSMVGALGGSACCLGKDFWRFAAD